MVKRHIKNPAAPVYQKPRRVGGVCLSAAFALASSQAVAQTSEVLFPGDGAPLFRPDAAGVRPQPAYQPKRIAVGAFIFNPDVRVSSGYNSNVFSRADDVKDDFYAIVAPHVDFTSAWGRHAIGFHADGGFTRFATLADQNSNEYSTGMNGRYDIGPQGGLFATANYARVVEPRSAAGNTLTIGSPVFYRQIDAAFGGEREFGKLKLRVSGSTERRRYESITVASQQQVDQSYRNTRSRTFSLRTDYAFSSLASVFVKANLNDIVSTDAPDSLRRDSRGRAALIGLRTQIGGLFIAEVAGGYRKRNFASSRFKDYHGLTYDAKIDWYPTELISFRLSSLQDIGNSGIAEVAAVEYRSVALNAYYELLRNVVLSVGVTRRSDRYREIDLRATSLTGTAGLTFAINRALSAGTVITLRDRNSSNADFIRGFEGSDVKFWLRVSA